MAEAGALSPETVMKQMKQNGVTDVVWLPDSETNWLFLLMQADPDLRLVGVTREGHACSVSAGLFAGGHKPMMLIQNTGMMESGDSIRGWLMGLVGADRADGRLSRLHRGTASIPTPPRRTRNDSLWHSVSRSSWSRTTATPTAFPPPSPRRRRPRVRSSSWSATNITASIGRSETS